MLKCQGFERRKGILEKGREMGLMMRNDEDDREDWFYKLRVPK